MTALDPRLNAFRPDLADRSLQGRVEAGAFVDGRAAIVVAPVANVLAAPSPGAGMNAQYLTGDRVRVFETRDGMAWLQGERDSYVGYVSMEALSFDMVEPTHRVVVPRTFRYPEPAIKAPPVTALSMGARLRVVDEVEHKGTRYAMLADGSAVVSIHLAPVSQMEADFVSVAERLVETPYLWGGASGFGMDCSGLVQLSLFMAGHRVLRDSDMQEESIGERIGGGDDIGSLRRGDLVFWRGHVGIMTDGETLLHANGRTMTVAREPLADAIARIETLYGRPTAVRRIAAR